MEPDKDPKDPSSQNPRFKSDPRKLKDLIKRFENLDAEKNTHQEEPGRSQPQQAEPVQPPPRPVEPPKAPAPVPLAPTIPAKAELKPEPKKPEFVSQEKKKPEVKKAVPLKMPAIPSPIPEAIAGSWVARNWKKFLLFAIIAVVTLGVAKTFLFPSKKTGNLKADMEKQAQAAKDAPVAVKGFKVGRYNYEDTLSVLGTMKGALELKLSFEIPGVISSINYKEGERYEEGALLVSLKQDDILLRLKRAQAAFNKAESQAKLAENEVAEHEKLFKMGAIPQSTLDKKKLEWDAAKYEAEAQRLEMKANEAMLEKSNLYAPSAGMLGDLNVDEGETISQSTLIGTHIMTEYVYAEFGIVERDVQKIALGQKAKVFVDAYPDKTFEGVIENIAPQITGTSRTSTVKVRVENPEGLLLPGMFARVRILLYSKKDALIVPTDAVQGGEGEKFVYVVKAAENAAAKKEDAIPQGQDLNALAPKPVAQAEKSKGKEEAQKIEEGVVEKRPVTVGYTRTDYSQIDAGLTEGEIIVVSGFERLEDGKKIRLVETQEAEL